ncbi:hypothetical protein H2200_003618 [Cladophialophora chaetospira]|uniref:Uncharacterized protein n=1 Tax=Cladophialophora chaetospira TaxID=386627 RepID=A0AA38XEJ1_9EURO|nr:hypothetical protein H2200_003618 [Cladophialophora chaetospira]
MPQSASTQSDNTQSNSTTKPSGTAQSTTTTTTEAKKPMSQNQMVRAAGFRNFPEFLLSYNLRIYNDEDVQEGKAILKALFQDEA